MSIITDFTNRRMYFWRGYYFGKEGIWCQDFNKEKAFCVLKDSLYKDYMVRAIADNGALEHRWDGFGINLAAFFNGNTDVIVLSL